METTRGKRHQIPQAVKTFSLVYVAISIVIFVLGFFVIIGFLPVLEFVSFLSGLLAGVLGILVGFSLDRASEEDKDNQIKDEFLKLIHEELTYIRSIIYPQTGRVNLLYTDIWDSVVSSGILRLLTTDQVRKLSQVYKDIKGASYEAEWIRRNSEEFDSLPDDEVGYKVAVLKKMADNVTRHKKRMEDISIKIDEVLKEDWWNKKGGKKDSPTV
jgi:hypothetical protein